MNTLFFCQESKHICVNGCEQRQENEDKFLRSRDLLTSEARQFVTASKLFVKSATESESQLIGCLNHCVAMIQRIGQFVFWNTMSPFFVVILMFYDTRTCVD